MAVDPHALFEEWFAEARLGEPNDADAMTLATADADGRPSARMVLLKGHDPRGFVFYTNSRQPEGRRARRQSARGPALPLEVAAPPGPDRGAGRAGERRRGRCLFRHPVARFPARRLGLGPVRGRWRAATCSRRATRALAEEYEGARSAASAALVGLSGRARADRILDRSRRTGCTSGGCSSEAATGGRKACSIHEPRPTPDPRVADHPRGARQRRHGPVPARPQDLCRLGDRIGGDAGLARRYRARRARLPRHPVRGPHRRDAGRPRSSLRPRQGGIARRAGPGRDHRRFRGRHRLARDRPADSTAPRPPMPNMASLSRRSPSRRRSR